MTWSGQRTRIRRYLRDPDANIWSNDLLQNLYNDEQAYIASKVPIDENVQVVRIPVKFQTGYMHDFEYTHTGYAIRHPYKFGYYDDKNDYVFLHKWEIEHIEGLSTASTSCTGSTYTHPWEAFVSGVTPSEPPPFPLPADFHSIIDLYWDRKSLEPTTLKEIQERDSSWRTHGGYPTHYYRHDELDDWIYLWPRPSIGSSNWQDDDDGEGDPDEAEYGLSTIDVDNNLLVIFKKETEDFDATGDVSALPSFLTKYIEYGVIARAYKANTDGRIESLAEYWEWRKEVALKILATYKNKRYSARHYRLRTPQVPGRRTYKHPRLPDEYPQI